MKITLCQLVRYMDETCVASQAGSAHILDKSKYQGNQLLDLVPRVTIYELITGIIDYC
jgi:hypothetical protein